jgi:di/tricarboxylate transporter
MLLSQTMLVLLFAVTIGVMMWGRVRHDLTAAAALFTAVALGLVPASDAFSGFSNEAVIVVALALIVSRALQNSGVLTPLAKLVAKPGRPLGRQIVITSGIGAALSTVMNNVAALTLMMPLDLEASRRAKRPPGQTLMPLCFATILGGVVTLIGTPPNIVASSIRENRLGQHYSMFDFTPVGAVVALAGIAFVAFYGWRLVPRRNDDLQTLADANSYRAELRVSEDSPAAGKDASELESDCELADVTFVGLRRGNNYHYRKARLMTVAPGDRILVEGATDAIAAFMKAQRLNEEAAADPAGPAPRQSEIVEGVVGSDSILAGKTPRALHLQSRFGLRLLGVAQRGMVRQGDLRGRKFEPGDTVLLAGPGVSDPAHLGQLGLIIVNRADTGPAHPIVTAFVASVFVAAVALASFGILSFPVALAIAAVVYAAFGIVPAREFYSQIDWPIVVMLACLLPIGAAFDRTGGTEAIADLIQQLTPSSLPVVALVAVMIVTTLISGVLNNIATVVIFGPVAIDMAESLSVNPDTFLMGVAIAASCSFLTPLGHKNNLLVMGPAGLRFGDYWRLGLPLSAVVLAAAVPMLLWVWPLT